MTILCHCKTDTENDQSSKPNILLIMADDLGYSDLGCYGSEIQTPNLDGLANNGLRFTNFYNTARCCPSRAALLTGLYPHQTGMGGMVRHTDQPEKPQGAYQGYLNNNSVTIAEVLKDAGYYTTMSGKWHVGEAKAHWPMNRGFDDYYGLISGASNYFDFTKLARPGIERHYAIGMKEHLPDKEGFYMTDAFTDHAVATIEKQKDSKKPFFMYLAYTAPHWPLHALPEDIQKYKGKYAIGWDSIRETRFQKMKSIGLVDDKDQLSPRDPAVPAWENMKNKPLMERKMEVYAAQIDRMDQGIGRVVRALKAAGKYQNTIILFLSDNGACAEHGAMGTDWWNNGVTPGGADSFQSYGRGWANASNTPLRLHKQWAYEGGIATPLIVHWPDFIKQKRRINTNRGHITDLMATLIDITGATYPQKYRGNTIQPLQGKSLLPLLEGHERKGHDYLYWEHIGNMAVMHDKWKLVSKQREGDGSWQLYDIENDRAELNDLAQKYPEIANQLLDKYTEWAKAMPINKDVKHEFSYQKK